jgi:hypothetical protein
VPYFTATPAVRRVQPKKCAGMLSSPISNASVS